MHTGFHLQIYFFPKTQREGQISNYYIGKRDSTEQCLTIKSMKEKTIDMVSDQQRKVQSLSKNIPFFVNYV